MPDNYRFSSDLRLRQKRDFDHVFQFQKKIRCDIGVLRYAPNQLDHPRIAIIASKRNLKLAVARNRLRRSIREVFRQQQSQLTGYDLIFIAHREASGLNPYETRRCLDKLFKRLTTRLRQD